MADISIPGVSNKYKTNDYIDALMNKEKVPLTREQESLDRYKEQQSAWRGMNQKMSSLRESTKTLYSFENPFNNKLASSSDENAITVTAGRDAAYGTVKIDVLKVATTDRFLSSPIEKSSTVPQGTYTFQVGEKVITMNWKGGKLSDFITSLNKRGANTLKASLVGVNTEKSSLLIESLKTGSENNLIFRDSALNYALNTNIIEKKKAEVTEFGKNLKEFSDAPAEIFLPPIEQDGMQEISSRGITFNSETERFILPQRTGFSINIDEKILKNENQRIEFTFKSEEAEDITEQLNLKRFTRPDIGEAGSVTYEDVTINNQLTETSLPPIPETPLVPIKGESDFYVHNKDGKEIQIKTDGITADPVTGEKTVAISVKDYPDMDSIVIRNRNTGVLLSLSSFQAFDEKKNLGYAPVNAISTAGDAQIKYEGITISRPENKIDDVIPNLTLNLQDKTEKTATITIKPDKDSAKDALINFVGNYNQVMAEMNILSENKPEIISELDYLSKDEQEAASERLGMFQNDFSITNSKTSMRQTVSGIYKWSENATITQLAQIGISSKASGSTGGYNPGQLRGYLEIDEKKLDASLEESLDEIKNIFGYDKDGDLIIDSGIAFMLDKQLTSWVQSGGIIANKNSQLDTRIKASETTIRKLEGQLAGKEQQLRNKYGQMEGTLNQLNSQSNTISNFANQGKSQ